MWGSVKIFRSNWWPVLAYLVMVLWLIVINQGNLHLNLNLTAEHYAALSQLDSVAHFTVALAVGAAFSQVYGRRWTFVRLAVVIFVWEVMEMFVLTQLAPDIFSMPGRPGIVDLIYIFDTLDDIALGLAGALVGCYLNGKPSNTASAIEKPDD